MNEVSDDERGALRYRIGVDVGGTFTDFALAPAGDPRDGTGVAPVRFHKVPSTPHQPGAAIARGVAELLERYQIDPEHVVYLGHGTTVATNQLIERKGARTGLLTTAGFRDVLEIARQTRPHLYDYAEHRAPPLVPRYLRLEIGERMGADGGVLEALDEAAVRRAGARLVQAAVQSVAICFLHAYRNPIHEVRAAEILRSVLPDEVNVCTSSEVLPEFREFERVSTTCANAYLSPRMREYLGHFLERLAQLGLVVEPYTFHSNGGLMSPQAVQRFPVRTCLSGPAAGVVGASAIAKRPADVGQSAHRNVVTFDVGGTSTDVSLVADGRPGFTLERRVAGYQVKSPTVDVHVIGAGGGSIAWLDEGGALKVGPHSAGATPGPAAYGAGGDQPTLTDANVVLQRLNPGALLGGGLSLDASAARRVIARLGSALGRDVEGAALGVVQVAVASIARAIRAVSTERGHELSGFALMAFGGAGPVLACDVAREVRCPTVIVPRAPGAMCARGILVSDLSADFVRTSACEADLGGWARCADLFDEMTVAARAWFEQEAIDPAEQALHYRVDARYVGQGFEVQVEVEPGEPLETVIARFHRAHHQQYGYDLPSREVEIVNCRLQAVGALGTPIEMAGRCEAGADSNVDSNADSNADSDWAPRVRPVYFARGWCDVPVVEREVLRPGHEQVGPLVIEEMSSTTLLGPGDRLRVDSLGNLVVTVDV